MSDRAYRERLTGFGAGFGVEQVNTIHVEGAMSG